MNREQEALLAKYAKEGKVSRSHTFWVRHKLTQMVNPIPGDMLSGFLNADVYELYEENPETPEVEDAPPVKKTRKQ